MQQVGETFVELLVYEHGEGTSEDAVVFVHDYFGNGLDFHDAGRFLASCGLRVLAVDLPGRGGSAALPADGYGLLRLATCFAGAAKECGIDRAVMIGKGWGGVVGALATLASPAQFRAAIFLDTLFDWSAVDRDALTVLRDVASKRFADEAALAEALSALPDDWFPERKEGGAAMARRTLSGPGGMRLALDPSAVEFVLKAGERTGEFSDLVVRIRHPQAHLLSSPHLRDRARLIEEKLPASGTMTTFDLGGRGWRLETRAEMMMMLGAIRSVGMTA